MRTISRTHAFKQDYRRLRRSPLGAKLDTSLGEVISMLAADHPLPIRFRDHALTGKFRDSRDCHIRPDLVLIYRKPDENGLQLVRLGSHSELSL
jgi:mRNA interferase YafQ